MVFAIVYARSYAPITNPSSTPIHQCRYFVVALVFGLCQYSSCRRGGPAKQRRKLLFVVIEHEIETGKVVDVWGPFETIALAQETRKNLLLELHNMEWQAIRYVNIYPVNKFS